MSILAYHITWTAYGAWLPGDERGWFQSGRSGIQPPDEHRQRFAGLALAEEPVILTPRQRQSSIKRSSNIAALGIGRFMR